MALKIKMDDDQIKVLKKALESMKDGIREGEAIERMDDDNSNLLSKFIIFYTSTPAKKHTSQMTKVAELIIRLAKTAYTYEPISKPGQIKIHLKFIKDSEYDALLSAFKEAGNKEPNPFVPKGLEKVKPADKNLVNVNMQRAYRIYDEDPIPEGAAEKRSVEEFVKEIFKKADLEKDEKTTIAMAPKIDGIALATSLKDGKFEIPTLKGEKNDESVLVKGMIGYELKKPKHFDCNVQYEVFVTDSQMESIRKELELDYKNNRAAASGMVNRLANNIDPSISEVILKNISLYPITISGLDGIKNEKMLKDLDSMGTENNTIERKIFKGDRSEIIKAIAEYFEEANKRRPGLDHAIDGIIVTFINEDVQEEVGRDKGANKYQFALKFQPMSQKVVVTAITQSLGTKGERKPLVQFEPVTIDGKTYKKCTIEYAQMKEFEISVGDHLTLTIVGDAIPRLHRAHGDYKSMKNPITEFKSCFMCGEKFNVPEGKVQYICENDACPGNVAGRIEYALEVLNVDGVGEGVAEKLMSGVEKDRTYVSSALLLDKDTMKDLLGKNKGEAVYNSIQEALEKLTPDQALRAMGVRRLGKKYAIALLKAMPLEEIMYATRSEMLDKFRKIDRFGDNSAEYFANGLEAIQGDLKRLVKAATIRETSYADAKTVGITGLAFDEDLEEMIADYGWITTKGKVFDVLITSDYKRSSKKIDRANELNIPIYTKEDFINALENDSFKFPERNSEDDPIRDIDIDENFKDVNSLDSLNKAYEKSMRNIKDTIGQVLNKKDEE